MDLDDVKDGIRWVLDVLDQAFKRADMIDEARKALPAKGESSGTPVVNLESKRSEAH